MSVKADRLTRDWALRRIGMGAAAGLLAAVIEALFGPEDVAPLVGWDVLALTYLWLTWWRALPLDGEQTAQRATRRDPTRPASYALLAPATVASVVAVGVLLFEAGHSKGTAQVLRVGLGVVSIVVSWLLVQTMFALHYARAYYGGEEGGIDFNQPVRPSYSDFAYLAFTIGMTIQVSDMSICTSQIRRVVLRHALASYVFSVIILAVAVNLITGLRR